MQEFIGRITGQITEYWGKLSTKNKIQIVSAVVVGIIALVILGILLGRPSMIKFKSDISAGEMSEIRAALEDGEIVYRISDDATTLYVDEKKQDQVSIIMADLGVISDAIMTYDQALTNTLSTTQSEKALKAQLAFEGELNQKIEVLDAVKKAYVKLYIGETTLAVFEEDKQSSASITLELVSGLNDKSVMGIVSSLKNSVPNLEPANISIITTTGDVLYDGTEAEGMSGNVSSQLEYVEMLKQIIRNDMTQQLLSFGLYDDVAINITLDVDFDEQSSVSEDYEAGPVDSEYDSSSEGTNSDSGGVPGTDSNSGTTTYPVDGTAISSSIATTTEKTYNNDKLVTSIIKRVGDVNYDASKMSVALNKITYVYEADVEANGLLVDMTWEQYIAENDIPIALVVDPAIVDLMKTGSGISDISVISYDRPLFISKEVKEFKLLSYLPIALIIILIGLLVYAVYKGTEPMDIEEIEPELSVEDMLESTKGKHVLEDIELNDKSDIRKQLEKFVDTNPEAVALLLRNWINEDWE
ncbi:MAG: flagellar basal-body MS-ring/collar protein FliF [Vallitaleaceae bacterium]|jgi:flagellar M-ring protein FliF|nr:flagellar basal-body MS-ring/collar protein FliF [Vallitaleaceae bacterium]